MRSFEILFESYPIARKKFSQVAPADEVDAALIKFKELVQKNRISGTEKDLSKWIKKGWEDFKKFLDSSDQIVTSKERKKALKSDAISVFEDDAWKVVIPLTKSASQLYGKGTKWCTAATNSKNYFEEYFTGDNDEEPPQVLVYFLSKADSTKFAIATEYFDSNLHVQCFDENDQRIDIVKISEVTGLGPLRGKLISWLDQHASIIDAAQKQITADQAEQALKGALSGDPTAALDYALIYKVIDPRIEAIIAQSGPASLSYARNVLESRFELGEPAILREGSCHQINLYASRVLKARWPEGEQCMLKMLKDEIYDDHIAAISTYATRVIKGRWKEAEQILLDGLPGTLTDAEIYQTILSIEWPELDDARSALAKGTT